MIINTNIQNEELSLLKLLSKRHSKKSKKNNNELMQKKLMQNDWNNLMVNADSEFKSECYEKKPKSNDKPGLAELEKVNFHFGEETHIRNTGKIFVGDKEYSYSDFPSVDESWCQEIKAENGVVNIENGNYYKAITKDGNVHIFAANKNHITQPYIENLKGNDNSEAERIASFWSILSEGPLVVTEYYSKCFGLTIEKQREYLEAAGIKPNSHFTVKIGDRTKEYYYSDSRRAGLITSKEQYDYTYDKFTKNGGLKDYPVGTKVLIDGKEYTISSHHNIDIPYGIDVFNYRIMNPYDEKYDWKKDPLTAKEDLPKK